MFSVAVSSMNLMQGSKRLHRPKSVVLAPFDSLSLPFRISSLGSPD